LEHQSRIITTDWPAEPLQPPDQTGDALRRISPHVGGDDLVDLDADSHLSVRPSRFE